MKCTDEYEGTFNEAAVTTRRRFSSVSPFKRWEKGKKKGKVVPVLN
jgi:hypothetical protein